MWLKICVSDFLRCNYDEQATPTPVYAIYFQNIESHIAGGFCFIEKFNPAQLSNKAKMKSKLCARIMRAQSLKLKLQFRHQSNKANVFQ